MNNHQKSLLMCQSSRHMDLVRRAGHNAQMERNPSPAPIGTDALAETLHLLRLTGTLYCRSELTAPWAIDMPPIEGCMMFHIVTSGHGWLQVDKAEPVRLQAGSLTLIPHGAGPRWQNGRAM